MSSRIQVSAQAIPSLGILVPAVLSCLLAAPSNANESETAVRSDIAFARGLAARWQFVDLAETVLDDLGEQSIDGSLGEELALVRCDIYAEGAKTELRPERREKLWTKAVDAYQEFLDDYELGDRAADAERNYVDLCNAYGLHLTSELEEAVGERAAEIRERIDEVLRDAVSRTGELADSMESRELTATQKRDYLVLLFNRAQLYLTLGKAAESGEYFFNQAESTLETLAFTAGETSAMGMLAYLLMGELFSEKGEFDYATDYYEFVVNAAVPRDPDAWQSIRDAQSRGQLQERWQFAERGVKGLVESYSNLEKHEAAASWSLHFYNTWVREGFNLSTPHGYLSLLAVARTMLRTGGFLGGAPGELRWFATAEERDAAGFNRRQRQSAEGLALAIADQVNRENRGNVLQVRAQRLISELTSNPGISVPPEVLFEAAKGEQNARNNAAAVLAFQRVLRVLESGDEATRQLFAPKVCYNLGRTLERMDRSLEAAMAFREGVVTWRGDPEFDPKNAEGYRKAISTLRRAADSPALGEMAREAEDLIIAIGVGAEDVLYNQAKRVYNEKDYAEAREAFGKVPGNAAAYEKALSYAAVCAYRLEDYDTAERELRGYVENFLEDPTNATTSEAKLKARQEAKAQAIYYLGRIALQERQDADRAIALLAQYDKDFPNQDSLAPAALYVAAMAQLTKRDFSGGDSTYERMLEKFPTSQFTGAVALKTYQILSKEQQQAEQAGDAARSQDLLRRMARNLQISNGLDSTPDFAKLRNESKHWFDLGEWETAREVLQRIASLHQDGRLPDATDEDMEKFVHPDLGHALLQLQNAADAIVWLEDLVADPDDEDGKKASSRTVIDYCRAVTGWVTGDAQTFAEVPGVGGEERIEKAAKWLNKIAGSLEKWECEWYGLKFDMAYAYYQWGQVTSSKTSAAESQIATLRTELGANLDLIREACGDDVLRRRFLTLWDRVQ